MKVLLSGATGFIGTKLAAELVRRNHSVVILSRSKKHDLPFACETYEWDPENGTMEAGAFSDVNAVVNLAGYSVGEGRWTKSVKEKIVTSRVHSTELLLKHAKGVAIFVNASAVGYYGNRGDKELTETTSAGEGFLASVCQTWESLLFSSTHLSCRKVAIRIGLVLGKEGGALPKMVSVFKKYMGGVLGDGQQWMSWIHIDDLVNLIIFSIESSHVSGVINGVAPQPVQNEDFTRTLAKALGVPAILHTPAFVLRALLGEMSELVLSSQRVVSRAQELDFKFRYIELQAALHSLLSVSK